jgi:hypothetical protein
MTHLCNLKDLFAYYGLLQVDSPPHVFPETS